MHSVALLTPSHSKDIERFALLCDSIDACLTGYSKHYVIVNDDDVPLFAKYQSEKRVVVPVSRYLPKWLWALPAAHLDLAAVPSCARLARPANRQDRRRSRGARGAHLHYRFR